MVDTYSAPTSKREISPIPGKSDRRPTPEAYCSSSVKPMYRQDSDEPVEHGIVSGFPVKFSGGDLPDLEGGAKLGHHNREVFERLLALDAAAMADLKERGVI